MNKQQWLFEAPVPLLARNNPLCQPNRKITHGGDEHIARIVSIVDSMCRLGWMDIRVNREQIVDRIPKDGKRVRVRNRPDVSGINPKTGKRVHIEIDTRRDRSQAHERKIVPNDPNATSTYVVIKPRSGGKGIPIEGRTYKPGRRTTVPRIKR